ncbi:MAG: amidohydrolase family protein [Sneathiella sp.]|nr:amidohydrolase family protein [Sneathiella sp.]
MKHLIFLFFLAGLIGCTPSQEDYFDLIISNVNLIDGTGFELTKNVNVYIKDNKIYAIDSKTLEQNQNILDGKDKFLIPGLFDSHVHTSSYKKDFERFIHFGITSIFVTGGSKTTDEFYEKLRTLGEQDSLPSPRVFHTSQIMTMEGKHPAKTYGASSWIDGETVFNLRDTLQIESVINQVSQQPIVGIKLVIEDGPIPPFVDRMPQEFVNKVSKEAAKNGKGVFAHISDNTELSMVLKADIKNIVHFVGIDLDFENGKQLIDSIYKSDLSWITTLMLEKSFIYPLYPEWMQRVEDFNVFDTEDIKILKDSSYIQQAEQYVYMLKNVWGIENPNLENIIIPYVEEINILNKNGVNMVLGTDTGNNFIFPGYSLHEEMQLMELGGIEPIEIIKMSSHNAAKMLDMLDTHGTIEVGKFADMILLDKDPLKSISNTLSINKVIKNGRIQKRIN